MINAIVQARVNSTRLPNKIFLDIVGKPLIEHIINRLSASKKINKIIIATSMNPMDDKLENWCKLKNLYCFRGSENNVLERFYFASKEFNSSIIVRITADDPFKDPQIIDEVIEMLQRYSLDFAYNNNPPSFPEGLDTEVFTFDALEKAYLNSTDVFEHEHVTQYFYRHPELFKQKNLNYSQDISYLRWTIDREEDLKMARIVYKYLYSKNNIFLFNDILDLIDKNPWIAEINSKVEKSAMYRRNNNEKIQ